MGLLDFLFGQPNPTKNWPDQTGAPLPLLNLSTPSFGSYRFGDPLASAEVIGKPDATKLHKNFADLYYHRRGFQLDIEQDRFIGLYLYFNDDAPWKNLEQVTLSSGDVITRAMTADDLKKHFGPQFDKTNWQEYKILQYQYNGDQFISELHFREDDERLRYWYLYLNY